MNDLDLAADHVSLMPQPITDLDLAFGGNVRALMPAMDAIPDAFKRGNNAYIQRTDQWFFSGAKRSAFRAKPGIDAECAFRHLSAILRSFSPSHEHKTAAVAYLMSLWFDLV